MADLKLTTAGYAGSAVALTLAAMLTGHEGVRHRVYLDPAGIPTVCEGHTGPEVKLGEVWSRERCAEAKRRDIEQALSAVDRCTPNLPDHMRVGLASFAFNVGASRYCGSRLAAQIQQGRHQAACAELSRWTYAQGRQLPGLVTRRADERAWCEGKKRLSTASVGNSIFSAA